MIRAVLLAIRVQSIRCGAYRVLALLCNHAREDGVAWPSVPTLARETGLSERQVQRALRQLEGMGLIHSEPHVGTTTRYRVDLHALERLAGGDMDVTPDIYVTPDTDVTGGVTPMSPGGDTDVTGGVTPMSPEPVIESVIEPVTGSSSPPYIPPHDHPPHRLKDEVGETEPKTHPSPSRTEPAQTNAGPGERRSGASEISRAGAAGMGPQNGVRTVGEAVRELTRAEAVAEVAMRSRWQAPPEPPREMVRALVDAGVWERFSALRRYARDGRAWMEWLAGPVADLWRRAGARFPEAVARALDVLARRPDVSSPLTYVERVMVRELEGEAKPQNGQATSDEDPRVAALRQHGVPFADGTMGRYYARSANSSDIIAAHPERGLVLIEIASAYARLTELMGGGS